MRDWRDSNGADTVDTQQDLQPEDNEADYFIESIHSNGSLDTINQTIKKYNAALNSARQGNDDLAIIQLKKVVSLNPEVC